MTFNIKNDEADRFTRQLAALSERLKRHQPAARNKRAGTQLARMAEALCKLPLLDSRPSDELLGYDENGLPT